MLALDAKGPCYSIRLCTTTADYTTEVMNQCLVANLASKNLLVSISHCPLTATLNLEC